MAQQPRRGRQLPRALHDFERVNAELCAESIRAIVCFRDALQALAEVEKVDPQLHEQMLLFMGLAQQYVEHNHEVSLLVCEQMRLLHEWRELKDALGVTTTPRATRRGTT